jgi:hypothetical protein
VPRSGGWREWGASRGRFEHDFAALEDATIIGPHIESELRKGRDEVRVTLVAVVEAANPAQALAAMWDAFGQAAGGDAGWDMAGATAEIRPEFRLEALRCCTPLVSPSASGRRR